MPDRPSLCPRHIPCPNLTTMPRSSDRVAWTQELDSDLPSLIESCQRGLDTTPRANEAKRERLEWQIRQAEKRMAYLRARLGRLCPLADEAVRPPRFAN